MTGTKVAPYGSWKSPLSTEQVASGKRYLGQIAVEGGAIYWTEGRPADEGRNVLMRWTPDGRVTDLTAAPFNVRSRVHEYGGGAFWVDGNVVYFVNFEDQRLYRLRPEGEPEPLTPADGKTYYADGIVDGHRQRIICVREDHGVDGEEPANALVSLPLDGRGESGRPLVEGNDFYASPRLSPDGKRLAWLTWHHPNMPWDGSELWVGALDEVGAVTDMTLVAGGKAESVCQPVWSPAGDLYFVSDRTGWWNLYRWRDGWSGPVLQREAEFSAPLWQFDMSTYDVAADGRLLTLYFDGGIWRLASLDPVTGDLTPMSTPYTEMAGLQTGEDFIALKAASPTELPVVVRVDLRTQQVSVLRRAGDVPVDVDYLSIPETVEFSTGNDETAHAYFYRPQNADYEAPAGEKPPLVVTSHGGPTSRSGSALDLSVQYWTSRGIAVLDVNYRGSTGYGRDYRERLKGAWGVVDVEDCINGARYLVQRGLVDGRRLAIRGGSAGGYTTLCALAFHDFFGVGACYFGLSDLERFVDETHKFESRYLHSLIGPFPEQRDLYRQRSPLHHANQLSCPIIFFQGLEDEVVPPNQSELMVDALREKGVPVAYLSFAEEQHGFRRGENIGRALEAELYFYGRILGFEPAGEIEPVAIDNVRDQE
ncbi:MAG: S9 family peptidase [Candidatus Promineifilaceae bacterium]|nr:S9 family peptidase [Candidatus Promineifilaceae bacterium]